MSAQPLSPQTEQYIADALSVGAFPSRESLLEAAVAELRAARADEEESLRRCDEAIDSLEAGQGIIWNAEEMKQLVRETYRRGQSPSSDRAAS